MIGAGFGIEVVPRMPSGAGPRIEYMRKTFFCLLLCWAALTLRAGDLNWLTSLPDAETQAKTEKKLVFVNVTGSDWCLSCRLMELDVFKKQEFIDYAKTNLVLVQIDFPLGIKQTPELEAANNALTNKFGVIGLPTYLALNPDGKELWRQLGYLDGGPRAMIAQLKKAKKKVK
jgi:thiol:disulfide interchange protein